MELTVKETGNAIVIYLKGNLDTKYASVLNSRIEALLELHQYPSVIVNLNDVEYMSSSCLSVFINVARNLEDYNRTFYLCHVNSAIENVMEIIKVNRLIKVFKNEETAVENLP